MSKTLFTAALAFVLSIGGFVMSAQAEDAQNQTVSEPSAEAGLWQLVVSAKDETLLNKGLKAIAVNSNEKSFGYKVGSEFTSLSEAMEKPSLVTGDDKVSATFILGNFSPEAQLQFGYGDENVFDAISAPLKVSSDAGFHAGYNIDSFYQLDFEKDPFNGKIEILIGEPLPASTVTLLVALAAAAGLLLYNNRRARARFSAQA
jgi:hypothetical protein